MKQFEVFLNCEYYETNALVQKFCEDLIYKFISSNLSKEYKLLEIGFGTGKLLNKLQEENFNLRGVEVSKKMYNFTRKRYSRLNNKIQLLDENWIENYEEVVKLADQNIIYSNFVFQWVDIRKYLQILSKNNTKIIFTIPLIESFRNLNFNFINILNENEIIEILRNLKLNYKINIHFFKEKYRSQLEFIKHLKKIGATKKLENNKNNNLFYLRNSKQAININYKIAFITINI